MAGGAVFVLACVLVAIRVAGVTLPFLPAWSNLLVGLILIGLLIGIGLLIRMAARRIEHWDLG